ncbi:MAG TPA: radical SAM protein [Thermoleophilaceae bacterium]|jgi:radical SAM superfamily enzyme YgiQ (UPF0313 family)
MRPRDRILTTGTRFERVPPNPAQPRLRVALINPPDPTSSDDGRSFPALGLGYVAAFARVRGFHVDLFDFALDLDPDLDFLDRVGALDGYDVYGVSTYSDTLPSALTVAAALRRGAPRSPIVFGGYHAAVLDAELLEDFDMIDYVVRDEGEIPFSELLDGLASDRSDHGSVASLTWRGADGAVVRNPSSERLLDQAELPFPVTETRHGPRRYADYADRDSGERRRAVSLVSSRGCPKRCTFCSIALVNPLWRARSAESIMAEVRYRYAHEPFAHVFFQDGNFFASPKRSLAFARELHAFDPSITWSGTATPDNVVRHAGVLAELAALNCASLELGIESGNEGSLERFGKGTDRAVNLQAIRLLESAGIRLGLDFIMFEPEMTLDDVRANLDFLHEADLYGYWPAECLFQELRLYPGTKMRTRHVPGDCTRHEVPPTPLRDAGLRTAFEEAWAYRRTLQAATDEALKQLEVAIAGLDAVDRDGEEPEIRRLRQDAQACVIELRHAPYAFLEAVASPSQAARPDELEAARTATRWALAGAVATVRSVRAAIGTWTAPARTRAERVA